METGRLSVHTYTAESKSVKSTTRLDRSRDGESQGFALQRRQHFCPRFTSPTLSSNASTRHDEVPITFSILPPATASPLPPPCNSNTNNTRACRHRMPKTTRLRGRQSPGSRPSCCNGRASRGPCGYPIRTSRRNRNPISARAAWQKHGWLLVSARLCYSRRRFLRRRWERQSDVLDGLFWVGSEMEAGHVS